MRFQTIADLSIALWSLSFAISVFVIACPCGLALAAPTALFIGAGIAARVGILAKGGGEAFQEAAGMDVVVFDKTGTLTRGDAPSVVGTDVFAQGIRDEEVLGAVKALEEGSGHPVGVAVGVWCGERGVDVCVRGVEETAGRGLKGRVGLGDGEEREMVVGNEAWLQEHGCEISEAKTSILNDWKQQGCSVVLAALSQPNGYVLCAMFATADPLRDEAAEIVQRLQEKGIEVWMISGDNAVTAQAVARQVGIPAERVVAGALPAEKGEKGRWIQSQDSQSSRLSNKRRVVGMVGDGINDAVGLTMADVGIAIGSGSEFSQFSKIVFQDLP